MKCFYLILASKRKSLFFQSFLVRTTLEFRVLDAVSPVILYRHRLEGVEEGIVVETVELIRVVLQEIKSLENRTS